MRSVHHIFRSASSFILWSDSESLDTDPKENDKFRAERSRMTASKLSLKEQNMLDEKILAWLLHQTVKN